MMYKGILKKRTQSRKLLILAGCGLMTFYALRSGQYLYLLFILLAILAVFLKKEHIVSKEGVDIRRSLFGMTSLSRWTWDQITALQPDYIKARPNARLLIEKRSVIRPFVFTPEDCRAVIDLAKQMNPDIYVDYYTEEEQEEIYRKNQKLKEQQAAQQAKAKENAKKAKKKKKK